MGWGDAEEAKQLIEACIKRYQEQKPEIAGCGCGQLRLPEIMTPTFEQIEVIHKTQCAE